MWRPEKHTLRGVKSRKGRKRWSKKKKKRSEVRVGDPVEVERTSAKLMLILVDVKQLPTTSKKRGTLQISNHFLSFLAATHSMSLRAMVDLFAKGFL